MAMLTMATPRMAILYTYGFTHHSQVVRIQYGYAHYGHTHYGFTYFALLTMALLTVVILTILK